MTTVKNIKITELPFETKDANFLRCVEYVKMIDPDYKKYIPTKSKQHVSFELTKTTSAFANCIRRYLIDEIPVYSMHVDELSIKTNDKFILADFLKKNIELIPFDQDIDEKTASSLVMSMHVKNTTSQIMPVYTRDIMVMNKPKTTLKNTDYFTTTSPLIYLRPDKSLDIDNITITKGYGKIDNGKFLLLSNVSYEILDVEPKIANKFEKSGVSSLNSNPKHFRIQYTTHRNIQPKHVMQKCCFELAKKLDCIIDDLNKIKDSDVIYISDRISLETEDAIKIFHFIGEYWTIANIIAKYCYIEFPEIKFVCSDISHPSKEESMVKINHPTPVKLMIQAIKNIQADVKTVAAAFK